MAPGSVSANALSSGTRAPADDLHRCIRDLLGLLALHDAWRTRDARGIFVSLLEALEATLPITFAHLRAGTGDQAFELLRADKSEITDLSSPWWPVARTFAAASPKATRSIHLPGPSV
jgi:hypothetical protein